MPVWLFIFIAVISAIVGYATNVIALKMSFYPIEFTGIKANSNSIEQNKTTGLQIWQPESQPFGLFGWQGIVPSKARFMASRLTQLFMDKLLDLREIFSRIDPEEVRKRCEPATIVKSVPFVCLRMTMEGTNEQNDSEDIGYVFIQFV